MEPQATATTIFFKETKPASIRLWHWLTFLFFTASITTVLFGSTLFKTSDNVTMVQDLLKEKGAIVTEKQARNVAHEYSDKMWILHKYIGFGLSALLLWRIIAEVSISKEKKLNSRIRNAVNIKTDNPEKKHYLFVQYSYLIFYALFVVMALTGLVLAFEDVEFLRPLRDAAEETHGVVQYGLYTYILLHMAGAIRADMTLYGGIISRMINGKN